MKKKLRIAVTAILVFLCAAFAWSWFIGFQPFRDLSADEIASVSLDIHPLVVGMELEEEGIGQLVDALRDVRIYNPTLRNLFSGGMAHVYTITFRDGSTQQVTAYNPTITLGGIAFRSEYEMADRLSNLAHTIADTQFKK